MLPSVLSSESRSTFPGFLGTDSSSSDSSNFAFVLCAPQKSYYVQTTNSSVDRETHCAIPKILILTEHTKLLANLHKKLSSHTPSMPTIKAKGTTTIASLPPFLPLVYLACGKRSSPCNTGSRSTTGRPRRSRPSPFSCSSRSCRRKSTGRKSGIDRRRRRQDRGDSKSAYVHGRERGKGCWFSNIITWANYRSKSPVAESSPSVAKARTGSSSTAVPPVDDDTDEAL